MTIYIGSDHGGFHLKQDLVDYLTRRGHSVEDEGNNNLDTTDDYPQFAAKVATKLLSSQDKTAMGILICKGAQGMAIAANRFKNIRASVVWDVQEARMTRNDNDSNILCLSARMLEDNPKLAHEIVDTWLSTPFSAATRHIRRIRELDELG